MTSAKLNIYIEVGSRDLFIDEAHTALDILPACCLVRFAAFFLTDVTDVMKSNTEKSQMLVPLRCTKKAKLEG